MGNNCDAEARGILERLLNKISGKGKRRQRLATAKNYCTSEFKGVLPRGYATEMDPAACTGLPSGVIPRE